MVRLWSSRRTSRFFSIAESVIKEFPDVEMDLDSWWGGRERWTYKIVDGHWKECEPWIICAYTENKNDYQRLRTVAKQDGIVPQYLGTKYYSELHWDYNQVKGEGTEEERKEKSDNLTRDLAEKLSRNLEDVELLLYYFNYDDYYYEINEIFKAKNGHMVTEQVDKGISVVLIEDVDSLEWIDGREPLLLHPMEYVAEMIRRAREGNRDCQYCVNRILEFGDKSLYESLLTEDDKKWIEKKVKTPSIKALTAYSKR